MRRGAWIDYFHEAKIFLGGELGFGGFVEGGGGDDFEEELVHFFGGFGVDGTIDADHAAEGRDGIAFEGALVGFGESLPGRGAAGIGVLDDRDDGLVEFLGEIPRGLQVDDVVVGKFLALELVGIGHADAGAVGVHGGFLVRIFAVAQVESFVEGEAQGLRERCWLRAALRSRR